MLVRTNNQQWPCAYDWGVEPCRVADRDEGRIKIIKVNLASGLEFVEEIEEAKCKSSARLFQRRRKQPHAEKLYTRWMLLPRFPAVAIANANSCDARNVEEGEIDGGGRPCAALAGRMTELVCGTELEQCDPGKKFACPFLTDVR